MGMTGPELPVRRDEWRAGWDGRRVRDADIPAAGAGRVERDPARYRLAKTEPSIGDGWSHLTLPALDRAGNPRGGREHLTAAIHRIRSAGVPGMRVTASLITLALLPMGCRPAPPPVPARPTSEVTATDPFAVVAETDRLSARDLWPGFDPRTITVAIYDGEQTLLFRHPAPPEGFQRVPGHEGVWTFTGRHPAVTANTSTELGNVRTATLMPTTVVPRAGLLIHESFHVFQREHHPGWSANEAELFTYPVDDPDLLALRRSETEALRRALALSDTARAACWARTALDMRRERFAALSAGSIAYERHTELNEGLATYVERRATGEPDSTVLPVEEFAPEAVRQRGYQTGVALARLLDQFSPTWRRTLEQNDSIPLDVLLATSLPPRASDVRACAFKPAEWDRIRAAAAIDIRALRGRRAEQRRAFLEQPGWSLVIVAPGAPLFPQGFDPLNVQTVARGEVLHTRFLQLRNETGEIEVLGRAVLTESAGEHPLFNGVRSLTVTGITSEPMITEVNGVVTVKADGVTAQVHGATVEYTEWTVTVRLPAR